MKFLIVDTDYFRFLSELYKTDSLKDAPYDIQMKARIESLFGIAHFYSSNLRDIGHEAWDIYFNNEFMQKAWAKEHGLKKYKNGNFSESGLKNNIIFKKLLVRWRHSFYYEILEAQIKHYKPDVLLIQAMSEIDCQFLRKIKPNIRLLVGQHAATKLKNSNNWEIYDLVVSSFPPTIEWFQRKGIPSELLRLGFEPGVLSVLVGKEKKYDVCFVGSLIKGIHDDRISLLELLCDKFENMCIWTPDINKIKNNSSIHRAYRGDSYGKSMFQILNDSKIVINHHGSIPAYANNMRLYEATGVGAMLITDWKGNLSEMFEIGKEVIAYHSPEECIELINYYLNHNEEREVIALSGNQRTLRTHNYNRRMHELTEIIQNILEPDCIN
jgi:spore maturation protein CgeB